MPARLSIRFRLTATGASATIFPRMSEAEKQSSLTRAASMNRRGIKSNFISVSVAIFRKAFLWLAVTLLAIVQGAFSARAIIYTTPMIAQPESTAIFTWGDGTHELRETWSVSSIRIRSLSPIAVSYQSADNSNRTVHHRSSKDGNKYLKIAFTDAAVRAVQYYPEYKRFFLKRAKRSGEAVARTCVAKVPFFGIPLICYLY